MLLVWMENDWDWLVVIIVGYSFDIDWLLEINEGLWLWFVICIEFDIYFFEEFFEIVNVIVVVDDLVLIVEVVENFF